MAGTEEQISGLPAQCEVDFSADYTFMNHGIIELEREPSGAGMSFKRF